MMIECMQRYDVVMVYLCALAELNRVTLRLHFNYDLRTPVLDISHPSALKYPAYPIFTRHLINVDRKDGPRRRLQRNSLRK